MNEQKGFFESIHPKTSFWIGFGGGVGLAFVVGFFIVLGLYVSGGKEGVVAGVELNGNTNSVAVAPNIPSGQPTPTPQPQGVTPTVKKGDHVRGPESAKVTMIEFSDIQCPFCQRFHPTMKRIIEENPKDVRWVYKHFPLDQIHPNARSAAEASECLAEQKGDSAFFAYLDALFSQQQLLGKDLYISEAKKLGANEKKFTECFDGGKYKQRVDDDYQQGVAAGVRGTPASFINGQLVSGAQPYEQVKSIVQSQL